jgi:hypothetical protein
LKFSYIIYIKTTAEKREKIAVPSTKFSRISGFAGLGISLFSAKIRQKWANFGEKPTENGEKNGENGTTEVSFIENAENPVKITENLVKNTENLVKNTENPVKNIENPLKNTEIPLKNTEIPLKNTPKHPKSAIFDDKTAALFVDRLCQMRGAALKVGQVRGF